MKKILTIAALASVATLSSYGQGFVAWGNTTGTRVSVYSANLGVAGGSNSLAAASTSASYIYALFSAPSTTTTIGVGATGDPTTAGWSFTGDYATNTAAGRLLGVSSQPDGTGIQIPGYGAGTTASFAVVGWSASLGATWAAVQPLVDAGLSSTPQGFYGVDQTVATGVALAAYPGPYVGVMGSAPAAGGFTLYAVPTPEPTTFALAGLGAAAVVVFRRRK